MIKLFSEALFSWVALFTKRHRFNSIIAKELNVKGLKRIGILVPHADDEIVGCYHFIRSVGVLCPIDLIYITAEADQVLADTRTQESLKATSGLPVNCRYYWEYIDGKVEDSRKELGKRLSDIEGQYDLILCTAPWDITPDHQVLGEVAEAAVPIEKVLWYRSTWLTFTLSDADMIYGGSANKKGELLRCFESQTRLALQNVVSMSAIEAKRSGLDMDSAEGFRFAKSDAPTYQAFNVLSIWSALRLRGW